MSREENNLSQSGEINRVALKLPQFWDKQADLWFINIEAQFKLADIAQDVTKYYAVVAALNSEVLTYVSDIVKNPPTTNLYETLKERLIAEFSDSEQKRLKDLLSNAVLGDERPTHLLRKMRQLANNKVTDDLLKTLWIQRLPKETQTILSVSEGNLDKLAQMADTILDVTPHQIAETQAAQANVDKKEDVIQDLQAQIAALTEQVSRLSRTQDRQGSSGRQNSTHSRYRRRSKTPNRSSHDGRCWYHTRFGQNARKCVPPCNFENKEN